jgi:hypothetical protein
MPTSPASAPRSMNSSAGRSQEGRSVAQPRSGQIPVEPEKPGIFAILTLQAPISHENYMKKQALIGEFPASNREFFRPNRELNRPNRELNRRKREFPERARFAACAARFRISRRPSCRRWRSRSPAIVVIKPQTMPRVIRRFHGQTVATGRQRPHPTAADTPSSYFRILRTSPCEACANRSSFVHKESQP